MVLRTWGVVGSLVLAGLAGCLGSDEREGSAPDAALESAALTDEDPTVTRPAPVQYEGPEPEPEPEPVVAPRPAPRAPQAVVALIDTGINPYHDAFRDASPLAWKHPSEYLPGYPRDAHAVELTLGRDDLEDAYEADRAKWESLEPGVLYWFPGTKIVGAYATVEGDPVLFDTGHGTMTASRAAGNAYSLCPECRIVMVQGFTPESVTWASERSWIDVQSNSWSPMGGLRQVDDAQRPGLTQAFAEAATRQLVFASAGNGLAGKLGVLGQPSFTGSTRGPPGVIAVGGHDNGQVVLWTGTFPHVAADACSNLAPDGETIHEYGPYGGGTSAATPYAAGAAARIVLEARRLLDDTHGARGGTLALGLARPDLGESPLADGNLTRDEVKEMLFATAVERPAATEDDGELCSAASNYGTMPIEWSSVPPELSGYPLMGNGAVTRDGLSTALAALAGLASLPEAGQRETWHGHAETLRELYASLP